MRDGDDRYGGKGVQDAVANVNREIVEAVKGMDAPTSPYRQDLIDLDGTHNKASLGANAILGVSLAVPMPGGRPGAAAVPLPRRRQCPRAAVPMVNLINGGVHAGNNSTFRSS